jgi:hypothetical protein
MKSDLSPCTKIISKWGKNLNVRPVTLKLLQENIGKVFKDICIGNNLLKKTLIAQEITGRID